MGFFPKGLTYNLNFATFGLLIEFMKNTSVLKTSVLTPPLSKWLIPSYILRCSILVGEDIKSEVA